MTDIFVRF